MAKNKLPRNFLLKKILLLNKAIRISKLKLGEAFAC